MCKEPAIFLQCSFSPVYVVLILIFRITWGRFIHDKFYIHFLIIVCFSCAVRLRCICISNPPENWRLKSISLSKLLTCLASFAFNASGTEVINSTLRLISLNVRGLCNFKKWRMIYTWCKKKNIDIIFLQETHSTKEAENQWRNEWGAEIIMSHGSSNSHRVAILMKKVVQVIVHSKIIDPQGRSMTTCMSWSTCMIRTKTKIALNFLRH